MGGARGEVFLNSEQGMMNGEVLKGEGVPFLVQKDALIDRAGKNGS